MWWRRGRPRDRRGAGCVCVCSFFQDITCGGVACPMPYGRWRPGSTPMRRARLGMGHHQLRRECRRGQPVSAGAPAPARPRAAQRRRRAVRRRAVRRRQRRCRAGCGSAPAAPAAGQQQHGLLCCRGTTATAGWSTSSISEATRRSRWLLLLLRQLGTRQSLAAQGGSDAVARVRLRRPLLCGWANHALDSPPPPCCSTSRYVPHRLPSHLAYM